MELLGALAGLAVISLIAIGWIKGTLFSCVFLTIPVAGLTVLAGAGGGPASPQWVFGGCVLLVLIWAPYVLRRKSY